MRNQAKSSLFFAYATLITVSLLLAGCDKSSNSSNSVVGKQISFAQGGNSEVFRISGWSDTEAEFTWTKGTSAKLDLPVGSAAGPWTLKVVMAGLIHPPDLPFQSVEVYANDKKIAEWQVGINAEFKAQIPADANKGDGKITIEFRTPKATTPKSLGMNEDPRVLGVSVRSVELTKGA